MNDFWPAVGALIPSIGVGALFYVAMRYIVRADRNERLALARLDAEAASRPEEEREATPGAPGPAA